VSTSASEAPPGVLRLSDFDYDLPPERIAQEPVEPRDAARLLVVPRDGGEIGHRVFQELPDLLRPDDLLVLNETRVSAVRLFGRRSSGAAVEALLLRPALEHGGDAYEALVRPGRKLPEGETVFFEEAGLTATVAARTPSGGRILRFAAQDDGDVTNALERSGRVPLPPYITAPLADRERYQTVYARTPGSAAAPTAGLHFTPGLMAKVEAMGVGFARVRLDVGLGTFRPIRTEDVTAHEMHTEAFSVAPEAADAVNGCRGRVIAVGTTSLRALESAGLQAGAGKRVRATEGETSLFIYPGSHRFRAADGLITNFHQPHSTLLLLVAAFVGRDQMRRAYDTALGEGYRFLSFGDAMIAL
jgi:S-adenosylmethionine:tRNA ribosyltransferase-isomerase